MATNNSVNLKQAGISGYNGSGTFVGNAVTAHNVLVGGATTDTLVNVSPSTAGFVLTSNGPSADPSFQSSGGGGSVTFTGDTGTPFSSSSVTIFANTASNTTGSSVSFNASTPDMLLSLTDQNSNVLIGNGAGNATVSGGTGGTGNIGIGNGCLSSLTTSGNNTCVGGASALSLVSGTGNCFFGNSAGQAYSSSESSNIILGINSGTIGESNVLRIGGGTGTGSFQQNLAFISGITGSTPVSANSPKVVVCDSTDNMTVVADSTAGFVLTSNSPNAPTFQAPVNAITFTNVGSPSTASPNNGYFVTGTTTLTLPASPAQGTFVIVYAESTAVATVTANTGQTIRLNSSVSASGGTAANVSLGASLTLYYKANISQWCAGSIVGTWTVS